MAGNTLRGAFVQFTETFPVPVPNIILFQYNPETLVHTWTPARSGGTHAAGDPPSDPRAISGSPKESFSLTLAMDANDTIADGSAVTAGLALASGIAPRLAALEMLLFPTAAPGAGLVGTISSALGASPAAGGSTPVPAATVPLVLFVWGPGRVLPVRLTALTITEKLYDSLALNPTHAEAQIDLHVFTAEELSCVTGAIGDVARAATTAMTRLRQALAIANLANSVDAAIGMLPV
jgi:hypothetical protein